MYSKTAAYYDALYHFLDYQAATQKIDAFIASHHPNAKTLLDVGCGTGKHLVYLKEKYHSEGLDLNGELLAIARQRCPDVAFHHGNMINFQLPRTYDVVACFFSSIGYVKTLENLYKAVKSMAMHLSPGGLLLIEPWFTPEKYWVGRLTANYVDQPALKIAWMYTSEKQDNTSVFDIHYMIGTPKGIEEYRELHVMGLWTDAEYRQAFQQAGLEVCYNQNGFFGRGLYYGVKK